MAYRLALRPSLARKANEISTQELSPSIGGDGMGSAIEVIVQPRIDARNEDKNISKRQSEVRAIIDRSYWSRKRGYVG